MRTARLAVRAGAPLTAHGVEAIRELLGPRPQRRGRDAARDDPLRRARSSSARSSGSRSGAFTTSENKPGVDDPRARWILPGFARWSSSTVAFRHVGPQRPYRRVITGTTASSGCSISARRRSSPTTRSGCGSRRRSDNGRRGRAVTGLATGRSSRCPTCSRASRPLPPEPARQARHSGCSVIVSGPPAPLPVRLSKPMALELFAVHHEPLVERKIVQNTGAAKRHVDQMNAEVWDILEEVIQEPGAAQPRSDAAQARHPGVRADARRGQGFRHPPSATPSTRTSTATRWPSVPLSAGRRPRRILMLSAHNILSPRTAALTTPTQDMVLGPTTLTYSDKDLDSLTVEKLDRGRPASAPRKRSSSSSEQLSSAADRAPVNNELVPRTPGRGSSTPRSTARCTRRRRTTATAARTQHINWHV